MPRGPPIIPRGGIPIGPPGPFIMGPLGPIMPPCMLIGGPFIPIGGPFIPIGMLDIIWPLGPIIGPGPLGPMFLSMLGFANLCRNSKLGGPLGPPCELGGLDGKYWIVLGAEALTVE